jgi:hypothetical protein
MFGSLLTLPKFSSMLGINAWADMFAQMNSDRHV